MDEIVCLVTGALGVNTYIVPLDGDEVFIVDPAACSETGDENLITGWLSSHGKKPVGIFLTHGHFDHITGIKAIVSAYPDCPVAIHKFDENSFNENDESSAYAMVVMFRVRSLVSALTGLPHPNILFAGGETLDIIFKASAGGVSAGADSLASGGALANADASAIADSSASGDALASGGALASGEASANSDSSANANSSASALSSWKIIHTPGHSQGSCCLYSEKENALISGDTMFYHSWGRTDLAGGNEAQLQKSLSMLRKTIPPETKVYPGHDTYGFRLGDN